RFGIIIFIIYFIDRSIFTLILLPSVSVFVPFFHTFLLFGINNSLIKNSEYHAMRTIVIFADGISTIRIMPFFMPWIFLFRIAHLSFSLDLKFFRSFCRNFRRIS